MMRRLLRREKLKSSPVELEMSNGIMIWLLLTSMIVTNAFTSPELHAISRSGAQSRFTPSTPANNAISSTDLLRLAPITSTPTPTCLTMAYSPPEDAEKAKLSKNKFPQPKIGDVVRYFDVDGGRADGQVLVGKISYIQPMSSSSASAPPNDADGTNKWLVEIKEMEDVGDGYFAEYPSRKRRRAALRKLEEIAPLPASFVRTEDSYKIPMERGTNRPLPSHPSYDLIGYDGPAAVPVNEEIVQTDAEKYGDIKSSLLRNSAIAGLAGTIFADLFRGTEDALIYAAGAIAGVAYLFFLGIKTDTMGSADAKLGSNISNLRFAFPVMVIVGVALTNTMSGDANPVSVPGIFSTVTPEQFGAAMLGFLTYRVPLVVSQLAPVVSESAADMVPGSAGMAMRLAADVKKRGIDTSALNSNIPGDNLVPILLICGPEGTGKTTLVKKLLEQDSRFVEPIMLDRIADGVKFERLEQRGEILEMDQSGRYGLAKEGILEAVPKATESSAEGDTSKRVVVVDANVDLAKKLVNLSGARLIGVWIGLDSLEKFQSRLKAKIASGAVIIPDDETEETLLRARVRQVVKDIEYGVVSGVFEFTILNEDIDESMGQLKDAAEYCFK